MRKAIQGRDRIEEKPRKKISRFWENRENWIRGVARLSGMRGRHGAQNGSSPYTPVWPILRVIHGGLGGGAADWWAQAPVSPLATSWIGSTGFTEMQFLWFDFLVYSMFNFFKNKMSALNSEDFIENVSTASLGFEELEKNVYLCFNKQLKLLRTNTPSIC